MTATSEDLRTRWAGSLMDNYGTPPLSLVRGEGARVWDADGREYLDLLGGIAVNLLGHAHPAVVEAVQQQVATLGHTSNLVINPVAVELAEQLLQLLGHPGRVLLCNSGAEANEAAFKIARRTGRTKIVSAEGGFHGRTMGALALTGQPAKREPFEPMPPGVEFVPYGDVGAVRAAVGGSTAMVRRTASAAAQHTGLPPKVVPCWPGPSRSPAAPTPMHAPSGSPPPRPLARVTTSGVMPARWWANQVPVRPVPVCTSSTPNSAPASVAARAAAAR